MKTEDISSKTHLVSEFKKIRFGEVILFTNNTENYSNLDVLSELADLNYHFSFRQIQTPHEELHNVYAVRRFSLIDPAVENYLCHKSDLQYYHPFKVYFEVAYLTKAVKDYITEEEPKSGIIMLESEDSDYVITNSLDINCSCRDFFSDDDYFDSEDYEDKRYESTLNDEQLAVITALKNLAMEYVAKFNSVPPLDLIKKHIMGQLSLDKDGLSPIVLTDDMKLYLPDHDNVELRMPPLSKAIYILFLLNPQGIRLKEICCHRDTLYRIHRMIKPGAEPDRVTQSIDNILSIDGESLQQKLSRSRNAIRHSLLNPKLAQRYMIDGQPGEPYLIDIDPTLFQLPQKILDLKNINNDIQ